MPDQALRYAPGGRGSWRSRRTVLPRVFVLRDGAPAAVPVVVGLDDGNFTEIVKGDLHPGDAVITAERSDAAGGGGLPQPRL